MDGRTRQPGSRLVPRHRVDHCPVVDGCPRSPDSFRNGQLGPCTGHRTTSELLRRLPSRHVLRESFTHPLHGAILGSRQADVDLCPFAEVRPQRCITEHRAHEVHGGVEIRLRPVRVCGIYGIWTDLRQGPGNEQARPRWHEVEVPGVPRCDHGLACGHRLSRW